MTTHTILDELTWRGQVHDFTPGLVEALAKDSVTLYSGFDPTADSLHVGSLVPIMGLVRFQRAGHKPIALAGGGTGLIGDPSGKSAERQLLTLEQVNANVEGIKRILERYLDFSGAYAAQLVNNVDWLKEISILEFLREVGKHFTINAMMGKESVQRRIETGISYTEFSYQLLQARDYLELFDRYGCSLQIGGSDQWGNITAGIDLIRRTRSQPAYGVTFPLVTKADGTKFGKTEQGNVWLTEDRTSAYEFYQFWFNTNDQDVARYLKCFTFLGQEEIAALEHELQAHPDQRTAQKKLAAELTAFIHGPTALEQALQASRILFGEAITDISEATLLTIFQDTPSSDISASLFTDGEASIVDLVVAAGLAPSKGEARRTIQGGGIYFNNVRVAAPQERISRERFVSGCYGVLRKGVKNYHLVRIQAE